MSDETNTTPGPWFSQGVSALSPDHPDYGVSYIVGDQLGGLVGAALPWPSEIFEGSFDRIEANARLIAAAPNMLKALKGIRANLVRLAWEENSVMIEGIDKVISEAEGGPK